MGVLTSDVSRDETFERRRASMQELVAELRERTAQVAVGGGEKAVERHRSRGKLTARERVDRLVDPGTAFLELNALAAWELYDGDAPSAGIVTGIGVVEGRQCVIVANDATVKGGTYYPLTVKKHLRAQEVARAEPLAMHLPRRLRWRFPPAAGRGLPRSRPLRSHLLQPGAPVGARNPADRGRHGLVHRGRRVRPGDVGRDRDREGDRHDLHRRPAAREGGDRPGRNGRGARGRGRPHTPLRGRGPLRDLGRACARDRTRDRAQPRPAHSPLRGSSRRPRSPRSTRKTCTASCRRTSATSSTPASVIARIVDGSRFHEFKQLYGETLVCGFARIEGYPVGILANQGVLFAESSQKGAHFIELACKRRVPLVFLQNITGFMVGKEYEEGGIARDGAKLVMAVACADVPKFTIVTGGSFGAGNYAMCGRAYEPRQLWMWPNARISVMGGEQAATVLTMVGDADPDEIRATYEIEGSPYYSTARLWDDGIIDPLDTRRVLALGLAAAANAPVPETTFGVFRM